MQAADAAHDLLFGWKTPWLVEPAIFVMWRGWSGWKSALPKRLRHSMNHGHRFNLSFNTMERHRKAKIVRCALRKEESER